MSLSRWAATRLCAALVIALPAFVGAQAPSGTAPHIIRLDVQLAEAIPVMQLTLREGEEGRLETADFGKFSFLAKVRGETAVDIEISEVSASPRRALGTVTLKVGDAMTKTETSPSLGLRVVGVRRAARGSQISAVVP